jgi:hypothetical protein
VEEYQHREIDYIEFPQSQFCKRFQQSRARQSREPDPRVEFIIPPDFYDDEKGIRDRDEYENYINLSSRSCAIFIDWWKTYRNKYPRLFTMILDFFAVPMISAECERVFSAIKNLITERRIGLKEDIIEPICLLRHWYKEEGVI